MIKYQFYAAFYLKMLSSYRKNVIYLLTVKANERVVCIFKASIFQFETVSVTVLAALFVIASHEQQKKPAAEIMIFKRPNCPWVVTLIYIEFGYYPKS